MADRHKPEDRPKAVRMPAGLPARVKAAADDDGVIVNGFIVAAIEEKLERRGSTTPAAPARSGATTSGRARRPSADTAPPATFKPAASRAHALTCKCGMCKPAGGKS